MPRLIDLTGWNFGRLTVLHREPGHRTGGKVFWTCLCSCGKTCSVRGSLLHDGKTRSCGCLRSEKARERMNRIRYYQRVG